MLTLSWRIVEQAANMERVYDALLSLGYPAAGVDWLRRLRLHVIVLLAILAWLPIIVVVRLLMWFIGA